MRVLVATAPFENLTSAQTGAALARAWAELGAQCAVVPLAEAGRGATQALADLLGAEPPAATMGHLRGAGVLWAPGALLMRVDETSPEATSQACGEMLRGALDEAAAAGEAPADIWLEVAEQAWADGGRGLLEALAGAHGAGELLADARAQLGCARLHLVTTAAEQALHLTGLRGITSVRGHARGDDPAEMLAADQALVDHAARVGRSELATATGSGAVGGLGFAVLALGGEVVTGPEACAATAGLEQTMRSADLVVTGYDQLEFGTKGGDLLPLVTEMAERAMRPVVAICRRNWISARELRTMGIDEAYALAREGEALDPAAVTAAARAAARTWSW